MAKFNSWCHLPLCVLQFSSRKVSNIVDFAQNVPNCASDGRLLWVFCKIKHYTKPLPFDFHREWKTKRLPVVLWPLCSCADWAAYRWAQYVWCSGINNGRKAIASLWLLCGSEEALGGWKRLMKSTRESGRVPTAQRCNLNRSPCTCFEAPLLSSSGCRSFNDLQISLIFPENIVGTVLSPSLPRLAHGWTAKNNSGSQQVQRKPSDLSLLLLSQMWSDIRALVFSW